MERLQNKKGKDIYEKRNVLESVKEGYDWLLNEFPETFVQIDAENAKKQVTTEILTALQPSS